MVRKKANTCNFCGRSEDDVRMLITGLNGFICDECAEQAWHIAQSALGKTASRGKHAVGHIGGELSVRLGKMF